MSTGRQISPFTKNQTRWYSEIVITLQPATTTKNTRLMISIPNSQNNITTLSFREGDTLTLSDLNTIKKLTESFLRAIPDHHNSDQSV